MKKHKKLKIILLSVLALFLVLAVVVFSKLYSGYEIYSDVRYGEGERNVLDIYVPDMAYGRDNNGLVLFIHGGSWSGGNKSDERGRCRFLASHGYIAATMNYTLYSENNADKYTVFGVLDEIDDAIATVVAFAAERGINMDKVATSGYSAGAHLSMLYSFSRADTAPIPVAFAASMAGPAEISHGVWGEDLTISIGELLSGEEISREELLSGNADEIVALLDEDNKVIPLLEAQLKEVRKSIDNAMKAIEAGIITRSTKAKLEELEAEEEQIELNILKEQTNAPKLTKEQILFALDKFRKLDLTIEANKERLIDSLVKCVLLYDDKLVITLNFKNEPVTVPTSEEFDEIEKSSDIKAFASP